MEEGVRLFTHEEQTKHEKTCFSMCIFVPSLVCTLATKSHCFCFGILYVPFASLVIKIFFFFEHILRYVQLSTQLCFNLSPSLSIAFTFRKCKPCSYRKLRSVARPTIIISSNHWQTHLPIAMIYHIVFLSRLTQNFRVRTFFQQKNSESLRETSQQSDL